MMIRTAWVETESGYDLVAAAHGDEYYRAYFEEAVEAATIDYDSEPQVLCLTVDDSLVASLFAEHELDRDDASAVGERD